MTSILKAAALGVGLSVAAAAMAQAQSVASLPPNGGQPVQNAHNLPYGSTQSFYPKAGGSEVLKEQHYQPAAGYDTNKAAHPYSTSIGPKPGSHSSGTDVHYLSSDADNAPSRHPYTATGTGPRPN